MARRGYGRGVNVCFRPKADIGSTRASGAATKTATRRVPRGRKSTNLFGKLSATWEYRRLPQQTLRNVTQSEAVRACLRLFADDQRLLLFRRLEHGDSET